MARDCARRLPEVAVASLLAPLRGRGACREAAPDPTPAAALSAAQKLRCLTCKMYVAVALLPQCSRYDLAFDGSRAASATWLPSKGSGCGCSLRGLMLAGSARQTLPRDAGRKPDGAPEMLAVCCAFPAPRPVPQRPARAHRNVSGAAPIRRSERRQSARKQNRSAENSHDFQRA